MKNGQYHENLKLYSSIHSNVYDVITYGCSVSEAQVTGHHTMAVVT